MKRLLVNYADPQTGDRILHRANQSFADDDALVPLYPSLFIDISSEAGDKSAAIAALEAEVVSRNAAAAVASIDANLRDSLSDFRISMREAVASCDRTELRSLRQEVSDVRRVLRASLNADVLTARKRAWTAADILANP